MHPRPPLRPAVQATILAVLAALTGFSAVLADDGLALPLVLAWAPLAALWWRHDAPVAVYLLLLLAGTLSRSLYGANGPSELLVLVGIFTVASRLESTGAFAAVALDGAAMAGTLTAAGTSDAVMAETAGQVLAGTVAAIAGRYVATRRRTERSLATGAEEARAAAEARAQEAVDDERRRIARELHDVVAHHVSVMTLQSGALRTRLQRSGADQASMEIAEEVRRTGQEAMTELRRLLGVLRDVDPTSGRNPQPGLDALDDLAERMRATGMPVDLAVDGPVDDVTTGMALAVHRIVQEALTNTLRHAGPVPATVRVTIRDDDLEVVIRDRGPAHPPPPAYPAGGQEPTGRGLIGMRERAAVYGGQVRAGPRAGGGFAVEATFPRGAPHR